MSKISRLYWSHVWFYGWGTWLPWKPIFVGGDEWNRHTLVFSLPFPGSPAIVVAMGKWWPCHCMDDLPIEREGPRGARDE